VDEAVVVSERPAAAGTEETRLLPALTELATAVNLIGEDEDRVSRLGLGLLRLAGSLRGEPGQADAAAVQSAVQGAELVARNDLRTGRRGRLPQLLPSFTYLVALPLVGQAEALRVSRQTAQLLDAG
jgi:hypothetical protein